MNEDTTSVAGVPQNGDLKCLARVCWKYLNPPDAWKSLRVARVELYVSRDRVKAATHEGELTRLMSEVEAEARARVLDAVRALGVTVSSSLQPTIFWFRWNDTDGWIFASTYLPQPVQTPVPLVLYEGVGL